MRKSDAACGSRPIADSRPSPASAATKIAPRHTKASSETRSGELPGRSALRTDHGALSADIAAPTLSQHARAIGSDALPSALGRARARRAPRDVRALRAVGLDALALRAQGRGVAAPCAGAASLAPGRGHEP